MILRNRIIYVFLFMALSISNCKEASQKQALKIDIESWNNKTYDFLKNQCHVRLDTLKLGDMVVPLKYQNQILSTMEEYLELCFNNRALLLKHLNDSIEIKADLLIFENYTLHKRAKYLIQIDEDKKISYEINEGQLLKKKEEDSNEVDPIFLPIDSISCSSKFELVPQKLFIFNRYKTTKEVTIYNVSISD
jgi:hypothetical protein